MAALISFMYLGRIVEEGTKEVLFERPAHPYTRALIASIPKLVLEQDALVEFEPISGEIPSPLSPPPGCYFAPRCPQAVDRCRQTAPALLEPNEGHRVACYFA